MIGLSCLVRSPNNGNRLRQNMIMIGYYKHYHILSFLSCAPNGSLNFDKLTSIEINYFKKNHKNKSEYKLSLQL